MQCELQIQEIPPRIKYCSPHASTTTSSLFSFVSTAGTATWSDETSSTAEGVLDLESAFAIFFSTAAIFSLVTRACHIAKSAMAQKEGARN